MHTLVYSCSVAVSGRGGVKELTELMLTISSHPCARQLMCVECSSCSISYPRYKREGVVEVKFKPSSRPSSRPSFRLTNVCGL